MDRKRILIIVFSILLIVVGAPDTASTANQDSQTSNNSDHKSDKPTENTTSDPPKVNQTSHVSDSVTTPPPPSPPPPATDNTAPPPPAANHDKVKEDPKNSPGATKQGKANPLPPHDVTKVKNPNVITVFDVQHNCSGMPCKDKDKLVACIENVENGSKKIVVVVHNEGEEPLEVYLSILSSSKHLKKFKLTRNQTEKINVPLPVSQNTQLVLNAGHGKCVLHLNGTSSEETHFLHLPSYDKIVTPINGAYLLISSVVIFGGIWGCCMFRKRQRWGGVDYQELEMAMPETVTGPDVETAEGWDQGWDDDWDENAVMSPGGHRVGRISANGLTSRAPVKDGWENDWDD